MTHALAQRQGWRCIWCEFELAAARQAAAAMVRAECPHHVVFGGLLPIDMARAAEDAILVSFEHFVPHLQGGAKTPRNGLAACRWCNHYRGSEGPLMFTARIVALVAAGRHPRQVFRATGRWSNRWPRRHGLTAAALAEALAS